MNFQNVNLLNSRMNMLSGNLLPIGTQFSISWWIYYVVVMLLEVIHTAALIAGLILTPKEKALKDGTVCVVITLEAFFILMSLYTRRRLIEQVVQKLNNILRDADETMKDIVKSTLKPLTMPFVIYGIIIVITLIMWTAQPIMLVFERNTFFYIDYNLPTAFSTEPISTRIFIASNIVMTIGSVFLFLKKFSVDIYMIYLVLLLTSQYRYISQKLVMLFQDPQDNHDEAQKIRPKTNQWAINELTALCRQQNATMKILILVKELLSINFSLLYLTSVFRFCFIGILMSTIPFLTFMEAISIIFFACGSVVQFLLFCLFVQTLSDASIEITDKAFNEGWYQFKSSIKRMFLLLMMSNNIECKIATVGSFNLSIPSFMTIMNQSYSIAVLFLNAN